MTTFIDGPAQGRHLLLKRAPLKLVVVVDSKGQWDALDQPEDSIRSDETAYNYVRVGEASTIHLNRGRNGSGFYAVAQYKFEP